MIRLGECLTIILTLAKAAAKTFSFTLQGSASLETFSSLHLRATFHKFPPFVPHTSLKTLDHSIPTFDDSLLCQTCEASDFRIPDTSTLGAYGNAMGCTCQSGYKKISATDGTFQYTCDDACFANGKEQSVSRKDGSKCAACVGDKSSFDSTEKDCKCTQPGTVETVFGDSSNKAVVTYRLNELYNETNIWKECIRCPAGTAVITNDQVNDGSTKDTAGMKYVPDKYTCAECPDSNMVRVIFLSFDAYLESLCEL